MSRRVGGARLRRTWPQRLLISFNAVCIVVALVGAGSLAYAKRKVEQIDRVFLSQETFQGSRGLDSTDPRNFLIVGIDSDDGLDADDPARTGRDDGKVGGIRSDTIMLVRVDPASTQAQVLSFPRDLWVDIPGRSRGRINTSLQFGGEDLLIQTIKANFDIDINHYVAVNFAGFQSLVELLDGVPVYFNTPVRDQGGLNIENAGCTTLDENGALAYVRARHLRYQDEDGDWVSDPTSDLGRISRQQDFIKRLLKRAVSQGARNPVKLADFVDVGVSNITLDEETTPGDLVALGSAFRGFDPSSLQTFSLPVTDAVRGGARVLDLQVGEAEPILARFRGTGTPTVDGELSPSTVRLQVLNGSGKQNQAAEATAILATAGFSTSTPSSTAALEQTEVRYPAGMEAEAVLVARHLYADPVLVPDPDVGQITVVTGADFGVALLDPRPAGDIVAPTTTTTTTASTVPAPVEEPATTGAPPAGGPATTTTTTAPTGFVPGANPPGVSCG